VGEFRDVIERLKREGFVRARIDGEIVELDRPDPVRLKKDARHTIEAVVDRLVVREGIRVRLTDSIETALKWGENRVAVLRELRSNGVKEKWSNEKSNTPTLHHSTTPAGWEERRYSTNYSADGSDFSLGELTPKHFSFNSHLGACPACHGLGTQAVIDPDLMISDQTRSIAEGAITPWRRGTKRMRAYYQKL